MAESTKTTSQPKIKTVAEAPKRVVTTTTKTVNSESPKTLQAVVSEQVVAAAIIPPSLPVEVGSLVKYVIPRGPSKGELRPALVTVDLGNGSYDLYVFFSPTKDGQLYSTGPTYVPNVREGDVETRGTFIRSKVMVW